MRNSKRIARFRISSCPSGALVVAGNCVQFSACARICSAVATPGKGTLTHTRSKSSSVTRRSCFSATGGGLPSHTVTTWRGVQPGRDAACLGEYRQHCTDREPRPPTPQLRAQSQARGLLMSKRDHVNSLMDLRAEIRSDKTISSPFRQLTLDWSGRFWNAQQ